MIRWSTAKIFPCSKKPSWEKIPTRLAVMPTEGVTGVEIGNQFHR